MVKTCCLSQKTWHLAATTCCIPCCIPVTWVDSFVLPCLGWYCGKAINCICCDFAHMEKYIDCTFGPHPLSVGLVADLCSLGPLDLPLCPIMVPLQFCCAMGTCWKRAAGKDPARLFADGIRPSDINQGGTGDCWLLSGIAALAEHPERVESLFMDHKANPRGGPYRVKLFDIAKQRLQMVCFSL